MSIWEQNSEKAKQWLEKLLKLMAMPADVQIGVQELGTGPSSCWLIIDSSQLSPQQVELLLANKGEGLDAIQSLANTILNIGVESAEHQFYIVEINGYRQQRQAELFDWVNQAATQVRQTGQEIELKALSSAERR
ncbi:MAG: RNA-binding protein, partial [Microcystis sp. M53599_WE4]|nr:RNA-binding protein [Microcystis sp. M53599_WE4]